MQPQIGQRDGRDSDEYRNQIGLRHTNGTEWDRYSVVPVTTWL